MATTLLQLRDDVRELVDDVNKALIGDTQLTRMINLSGRTWHNKIAHAMPETFEMSETVTPGGVADVGALPTDHYKTLGVRYIETDGSTWPLKRLMYNERWQFDDGDTTDRATGYFVSALNLYIYPAPATGSNNYKHDYVRAWDELSADGDTVMTVADARHNMLDHWVQWIVYDVAIRVRSKEETPITDLLAMKRDLELTIDTAIQDRDSANPEHVVDTRRAFLSHSHDRDFWTNR
jgi:hypothetical protein